jgi:predicted secreted protein
MWRTSCAFTARYSRSICRNADDPHLLRHHGHDHLKEQLHAELVTEWVWKLNPAASEALLLAARAHHVRRWTLPREDFPTGRAGYLQWRLALKEFHAGEAAAVLAREGVRCGDNRAGADHYSAADSEE